MVDSSRPQSDQSAPPAAKRPRRDSGHEPLSQPESQNPDLFREKFLSLLYAVAALVSSLNGGPGSTVQDAESTTSNPPLEDRRDPWNLDDLPEYEYPLEDRRNHVFQDGQMPINVRNAIAPCHCYLESGQRSRYSDSTVVAVEASRCGIPLPPDACNTLSVQGVPSGCTCREVSHIFRPFPGFKEVRLVPKGSSSNALCFVDFTSPEYAARALNDLQGYKFDLKDGNSTNLRLEFAEGLS